MPEKVGQSHLSISGIFYFYTVLIDTSSEQQPGIRLAVTFRSQFGNSSQLEFYEYMFY